jgi:hypothetical protein
LAAPKAVSTALQTTPPDYPKTLKPIPISVFQFQSLLLSVGAARRRRLREARARSTMTRSGWISANAMAILAASLFWVAPLACSKGQGTEHADADAVSEAELASVVKATYRFKIREGRGVPVCEAVAARMNEADYRGFPPYCSMPQDSHVDGFRALGRVYLSKEEMAALWPHVSTFAFTSAELAAERLRIPEWKQQFDFMASQIEQSNIQSLVAWRYEPPIPLKNDGVPVSVVIWHDFSALRLGDLGGICGSNTGPHDPETGVREPQIGLVLSKNQKSIDVDVTKKLFGQRRPDSFLYNQDETPPHLFHWLGDQIDVFEYSGKFYIETFYGDDGDFEGKRKNDEGLKNTLAVLIHEGKRLRSVCELEMQQTLLQ